jgi:hypothetical protein
LTQPFWKCLCQRQWFLETKIAFFLVSEKAIFVCI